MYFITIDHIIFTFDLNRLIQALISAGANVESRNNFGNTPLHAAVMGSSYACARELLNYDDILDINARNSVNIAKWTFKICIMRIISKIAVEVDKMNDTFFIYVGWWNTSTFFHQHSNHGIVNQWRSRSHTSNDTKVLHVQQ